MEKIIRKDAALRVAEAWKNQYFSNGKWSTHYRNGLRDQEESAEITYRAILAADGNPDVIDAAIGNDGWTRAFCSECREYKDEAINFSNHNEGCIVCMECVQKAVNCQ